LEGRGVKGRSACGGSWRKASRIGEMGGDAAEADGLDNVCEKLDV
jgi:hypothetical protein